MGGECNGTSGRPLRVLAFEGWDHGSHASVRRAITHHGRHDWTWVTLDRGHWRWRLRMSAVSLARAVPAGGYDVVVATSMVSLTDLVALLDESHARLPRVYLMHENQAAYPASGGRRDHRDDHLALTQLNAMLAADVVLWNSVWNRDSFAQGISATLDHARGGVPDDLVSSVLERSQVTWLPVEPPQATDARVLHNAEEARNRGLTLVAWPHRWEHDKGPERLLEIDRRHGESRRLGWILLGEQFQRRPEALETLVHEAGDRIVHAGHLPRSAYESWLCEADWVCSTAHHEFFGIAVIEALLAGCRPWLPDALSYPELVGEHLVGRMPGQNEPTQEEMLEMRRRLEACEADRSVAEIEGHVERAALAQ